MHPMHPVHPYGCDQRKPGMHLKGLCIPTVRNCMRALRRSAVAAKPALSDALSLFRPYPYTRTRLKTAEDGSQWANESHPHYDKEIPTIRHTSSPRTPQRPAHTATHHVWEDITVTSLDVEPFYTVADAENLLKVCRTELWAEMRRGRLRFIKRGRSRRIPAEWLNEYRTLLITEGTEEGA